MSVGSHATVLLEEAVDGLNVRADGIYVDCTFGRGGHSRLILARLGEGGRLIAIDRDLDAVRAGGEIGDRRFSVVHGTFGQLREIAVCAGVTGVDGILLDLGVSSPQFDNAARGFSFRRDGPLDMRMDTSRGETAGEWLARGYGFCHERGKLSCGVNRPPCSSRNNRCCNLFSKPFFAIIFYYLPDFRFGCLCKPLRSGNAAARIHAHVERRVVTEAEAARRVIELR